MPQLARDWAKVIATYDALSIYKELQMLDGTAQINSKLMIQFIIVNIIIRIENKEEEYENMNG